VHIKGQEKELTLQVVETPGPALFGHNWLSKIQLYWGKIKALNRRGQATQSRSAITEVLVHIF